MKDLISNLLPNLPWVVTIIVSIVGGIASLIFYKKLKDYIQILYILIDAVEFCDDKIKDIVPDKAREVMEKIKQTINSMLKLEDKKKLDILLQQKGYLENSR